MSTGNLRRLVCLRFLAPAALALGLALAATPAPSQEPPQYTPAQVAEHIGEQAIVCGKVVSATYASRSRGRPTFLNLDKPYPDHIFTAVIWGENRSKFDPPPDQAYRQESICVTGRIKEYRGKPQVIIDEPNQITLVAKHEN